jgi:hypothetical protein
MAPIQTTEELLVHLAEGGDPSAFQTLVGHNALSTYVALRSLGKNHAEAMTLMVPFLKKLHSAFVGKSLDASFDEWYNTQRKKLLPRDLLPQEDAGAEAVIETIPPGDVAHFESQMRLALQRNYSRMFRAGGRSGIGRTVYFVASHRILRAAILTCAVLVVAGAALCAWLTLASATVTVTFSKADLRHSIELPKAVNGLMFWSRNVHESSTYFLSDSTKAADSARTKSADLRVARDSFVGPPSPEKAISQRSSNAYPLSSYEKRRPVSRPRPVLLPDSAGAVNSRSQSPAPTHPTVNSYSEAEKVAPAQSRTAKRPSPMPDSSVVGP